MEVAVQEGREVTDWVEKGGESRRTEGFMLVPSTRMSKVAHTAEVQATYSSLKLTSKPVYLPLNLYLSC